MVYSISEKESDHLRQTHKSKPGKDIKYSDRGEENWEGDIIFEAKELLIQKNYHLLFKGQREWKKKASRNSGNRTCVRL